MNKLFKFSALLLFCISLLSHEATAKDVYTFAVVPQTAASDIHKNWRPFLEVLSSELNVTFQLRVYPSIPEFEDALSKGEPDFAYMNPYHAVMAQKSQYNCLVRDKADLVGILVTAKNGPVQTVKDLDGKLIVFPSPNAFAASLYMRALLIEKENVHLTAKYVQTHQNVYKSVALSMAAAGGGVQNTLDSEEAAVRDKLTILYKTPGTASHPIAAQSRVPAQLQAGFKKAIVKIAADPRNKEMMKKINMASPVAADFKRDYAPLTHLRLEKYVETGK